MCDSTTQLACVELEEVLIIEGGEEALHVVHSPSRLKHHSVMIWHGPARSMESWSLKVKGSVCLATGKSRGEVGCH